MREPDRITVAPNLAIGDLPILVAIREGLFLEYGLEVVLEPTRSADNSHLAVFARQKERLFETSAADVYNACQWGTMLRAGTSARRTVVHRRPAIIDMALVVADPGLLTVDSLAGAAVAVSWQTGSHYMCLRLMEGFLPREQINPVHIGYPTECLEALENGKVQGAMLMEPFLSLAEKRGHEVLVEGYFLGGDIVSDRVSAQTWQAYQRAVTEAVRLINADPRRYVPLLIEREGLSGQLTPAEVRAERLRYAPPDEFSAAAWNEIARWMRERGLDTGEPAPTQTVPGPVQAP